MVTKNARRLTAALLLLTLLGALVQVGPAGASVRVRSNDRVTLCHQVGGPQYVQITIAPAAALNGHVKNHPLDIIPPFEYQGVDHPGQNWDADGQATWANGCVAAPSAQPIAVFVSCVENGPAGTYTARFGYKSLNTVQRTVPAGADNAVQPGGPDRGQPTSFLPGRVETAFKLPGIPTGQAVTWTLRFAGQTSTATADGSSPACETSPPPVPKLGLFAACVDRHDDGTYDATFGYTNDASIEFTIAVGPDNTVSPGGPDRGQPSVFVPGRVERAFTVRGVPGAQKATWTVRKDGTERVAVATAFGQPCADPPPEAKGIGIFVTCVTPVSGGTYSARFGYENPNKGVIEVPLGLGNRFTPDPADRGQPTLFKPGKSPEAFSVSGIPADQVLEWTLAFQGTRTATATAGFPVKCDVPPPPPEVTRVAVFLTCVTPGAGGTYAATFGYENPAGETVVRPIGDQNRFVPAPADRGQPSSFEPGNVNRAFTVKGIPGDERPEWRVANGGGAESVARATPEAPNCVTQPPPGPDVDVGKTADVSSVSLGAPVRFTLTVTNRGTASSWGVRLRDRLPAGLRFVRLTSALRGVACRPGRAVVCRRARLAPGARFSVTITTRPLRSGTLINDGELDGSGTPSNPIERDRGDARVRVKPRRAVRPLFTG